MNIHDYIAKAIDLLRSDQRIHASSMAIANMVDVLSQGQFGGFDVRRELKRPRYEFGPGGWRVAQ